MLSELLVFDLFQSFSSVALIVGFAHAQVCSQPRNSPHRHRRRSLRFGRTGRVDDRGVDNGALAQRQPLDLHVGIDGFQDACRQLAFLQQVSEAHDRSVLGNRGLSISRANWRIEVISYTASSIAGSLS